MPSYFFNHGIRQEISDDFFDLLWDSIDKTDDDFISTTDEEKQFSQCESSFGQCPKPNEKTNWRKQSNGFYNNKHCDENYFKKYYPDKTKSKCVCNVCGTELSCKSNLAKHKKTKKCRTHQS